MYVRDFRVSILVCKAYKINTKTLQILVILLIRPLGPFTLQQSSPVFKTTGWLNSACHLSEVDKMSTRNFWELSG